MSSEPGPKIIVDDDWKTRVQAEKEAALHPPQDAKPAAESSEKEAPHPQLPAPSFPLLISTLATEALAGLGQIPGPDNQPLPVNLEHAKHFIDTLAMLDEKTKGNLSREEALMLENVLHELRIAFVAVSSRYKT